MAVHQMDIIYAYLRIALKQAYFCPFQSFFSPIGWLKRFQDCIRYIGVKEFTDQPQSKVYASFDMPIGAILNDRSPIQISAKFPQHLYQVEQRAKLVSELVTISSVYS